MSSQLNGNTMYSSNVIISANRTLVEKSYEAAKAENHSRFVKGDDKATLEYIYPNQMEDANNIVHKFYAQKCRVVSVQKRTKVGADGLMIEIAKLLTTHNDDTFVVNLDNVRFITGMSNVDWERDMKDKAPNCFKDKIFHHGKLSKSDLRNICNGLIIIDEIDTGNKESQVLHSILKEAGVLDVEHMKKHNNRFVFISATMIRELYDLYRWGKLHESYKMTIPVSYVGVNDFLVMGIIKEFYSLNTNTNADKWVQEDILDNYGNDYRIHFARVNTKTINVIQNACIRKGVLFRNHTSTDRLTQDEIKEYFTENLTMHVVLAIKGFYRRANLIPNRWKIRIGATHELYTKTVDNNVQNQGLPARLSGYWREIIEAGHKIGPYRTSIKAIEEYEKIYEEPFGVNSYQSNGFKKKRGIISAHPTMLSAKNVKNLEALDLPIIEDIKDPKTIPIVLHTNEEEFNTIHKINNKWDLNHIKNIIKNHSKDTYDKINLLNNTQVVLPIENDSYNKLIVAFVKASERNAKYTWVIGKKTDDTYQIYLDNRSFRIIVTIHYGSKTKT